MSTTRSKAPPPPSSRRGIGGGKSCGVVDLTETVSMSQEELAIRFPRGAAVIEASRVAENLRSAAAAIEELAGCAHMYEPGTLRRKLRAVRVRAAEALLDIEGRVDHFISTGGVK